MHLCSPTELPAQPAEPSCSQRAMLGHPSPTWREAVMYWSVLGVPLISSLQPHSWFHADIKEQSLLIRPVAMSLTELGHPQPSSLTHRLPPATHNLTSFRTPKPCRSLDVHCPSHKPAVSTRPDTHVDFIVPHLLLPGLCTLHRLLPRWAGGSTPEDPAPMLGDPTDQTGLFPSQTWALASLPLLQPPSPSSASVLYLQPPSSLPLSSVPP